MMKFDDLPVDIDILDGAYDAGFDFCMPVQEETIPHALAGRDVFVQSQTGSGKTAAFLIPMFQHLIGRPDTDKALVIAPTRELAVQIEEEAQLLGRYLNLRIGCFYGGVGYGKQDAMLAEGVDIYVATPGRLIDYARSRKIDLHAITMLVIDEADRLFDMGFLPDLHTIMRQMRPATERQTMLFSATLPSSVRRLAREFMRDPAVVEIVQKTVTVDTVTQEMYHVGEEDKFRLLLGILNREKPGSTLVFTNTKHAAEAVADRLTMNGLHARHLSGDLPQDKRMKVLEQIKEGRLPILVATDVAARGLHINDLDLVVNYDLPDYPENYVHRIGRTARAGKSGKAISLACQTYCTNLPSIESLVGFKIPAFESEGQLAPVDQGAARHGHRVHGHMRNRPAPRMGGRRPPQRGNGPRRSSSGHGPR